MEENKIAIGHYVTRLANCMERNMDNALAEFGVTGKQARLLGFIKLKGENGCIYQRDIENAFGIRRSSVTSILQNLERGDFIQRMNDSNDCRSKLVKLTKKGHAVFNKVDKEIERLENAISILITPAEKERFKELSEKILDLLSE